MEVASTSGIPGHPTFTSTGTIQVPVFHPTLNEMLDFPGYLNKIEREHGTHLICGIAKIVPPIGYRMRKCGDYSDVDNYIIEQPVKEKVQGHAGIYCKTNKLYRRSMTVKEFRILANKMRFPKGKLPPEDVEKHYWKTILQGEPIYGADTPGSICDSDLKEFNMNRLGTILDMLNESGVKIKGVNTVYLYFGMWKTTFPWHTEDMDLYSINYVHFGEPKFWYAIATESNNHFERLCAQSFPNAAKSCKSFMRHKNFIISPQILRRNNIHFGTMIQYANEFIITFPRGYHMGFNMGYNCAESTNFASDRWIDFGKNAMVCACRPDSVEIDMRPFMKRFRVNEFNEWHQYWYGERIVRDNKKRSAGTSKRQPIHEDNIADIEPTKKQRRGSEKNGGIRGPFIDDVHNGDAKVVSINDIVQSTTNDLGTSIESIATNKWKKEMRDLWSYLPVNLYAEKEFNNRRASEAPHCAICQYFVPKPLMEKRNTLPATSRRIVKRYHYAKMNPDLYDIKESADLEDRLLRCSNCYVVVHEGCYPVGHIPADKSHWRCVRCRRRDDLAVRSTCCHLCELRGGALIPAENAGGDFVHVVCALLNRRTIFPNPMTLESAYTRPPMKLNAPIKYADRPDSQYLSAFGVTQERGKFQCEYCKNTREGGLLKCYVCEETLFHATCARMAGASFEFRNWPDLTVVVCPDHNEVVDDSPALSIGDKVRVYLPEQCSNRLSKGIVKAVKMQEYCTVNFMDRNWSDDMQPEDIIECECSRINCNGWHIPGAKIKIKWDDGTVYEGVFRNRYTSSLVSVELVKPHQHSSNLVELVNVKRDAVFARGERLADIS
ncbi:unnamed protein product [Anisakis simplex]|uniref:[histone H3]-trimethyl-L-lysine(9) demethylase n=1 Tax=Anisakis simplex TaxID=6269 RepID=A0A0M3K5D3_ANISI|nr:unnamed protein product [Anisakis simplex]